MSELERCCVFGYLVRSNRLEGPARGRVRHLHDRGGPTAAPSAPSTQVGGLPSDLDVAHRPGRDQDERPPASEPSIVASPAPGVSAPAPVTSTASSADNGSAPSGVCTTCAGSSVLGVAGVVDSA